MPGLLAGWANGGRDDGVNLARGTPGGQERLDRRQRLPVRERTAISTIVQEQAVDPDTARPMDTRVGIEADVAAEARRGRGSTAARPGVGTDRRTG
jgi:hypothetical protein